MTTWADIALSANSGIIEYEKWPEEGQHVGLFDEDGNFQVYGINRTTLNGETKKAECNHIFYEFGGGEPRTYAAIGSTPSTLLAAALVGTRWEVGTISASLAALTRTFSTEYVSPLYMLRTIESEFDARLSFRATITDHQVTHLYVDLLEIDDVFAGQRFEFGHNLQGISIDVELPKVTALVGLAPGKTIDATTDYTPPLTFASINGGRNWVGDEDARLLYGIPDGSGGMRHRFGTDESTAKTAEELLEATLIQVGRQTTPRVTIEAEVTDLEKVTITDIVTGTPVTLAHEKIRLNNVTQVIARAKGLLAAVEVPVIRIERYLKEAAKTKVTFGDPIMLQSDYARAIENSIRDSKLRRSIHDRAQLFEVAEAGASKPYILDSVLIGTDAIFSGALSAATGTFAELMAGTLGGARMEMGESAGEPFIDVYDASSLRMKILKDRINFYDSAGTLVGYMQGWSIGGNGILRFVDMFSTSFASSVSIGQNCYVQGSFRMDSVNVPPTSASSANAGTIVWDANYLYVHNGTVWKRATLSTW